MIKRFLENNNIKIGTQFIRRENKRQDIETVIDIYTTYNIKNQIVNILYVAEHNYINQKVIDYEVPAATIIRGLIKY